MKPAPDPRVKLIAQIHIAKKQLGLTEAEYRGLLASAAGKESCSAMNAAELGKVIEALVKAGFKPGYGHNSGETAESKKRSDRPVIRLIFGLWSELGARGLVDNPSRQALFAFVKRMTGGENGGVSHPNFLTNAAAQKIVEALKAIRDRKKEAS